MAAGTLISVDEYLSTSYEPDCDYVDGELVERNVGEQDHAEPQIEIVAYLRERRKELGIYVSLEWRMQVSATRFRVPDITVLLGPRPKAPVLRTPPFICIEVLSKDDRMSSMSEKIDDYLNFGVKYVWVIDPRRRKGWIVTTEATVEAKDGVLRTSNPEITVPLSEIYARIAEL